MELSPPKPKTLEEKIQDTQNAMQLLAIRICENNPDWRELKGRLQIYNELLMEKKKIDVERKTD